MKINYIWKVGMPLSDKHKKILSRLMKINNPMKNEDVAKRVRISKRGKTSWNKGKIEWNKCQICEKQIRKWKKVCSKECLLILKTGRNTGPWQKGSAPWNKGIKRDEEFRKACRERALRLGQKWPSRKGICGEKHPMFGKHHTVEAIRKISESHKGKIPWNYQGITPFNKLERKRFRDQMQKDVFERDNYTCQLCGDRGKDLQVDHIQSWAEYVELRFNINNCRTLCAKCHYQITFGKPMPEGVQGWGHHLLRRKIL